MIQRLRKLIRPLIPDRVMARYRLRQHSKSARVNVDVFVETRSEARRWLATTPDTYRARLDLPSGETAERVVIVEDPDLPVDESVRAKALSVLADPDIAASVVGEAPEPRLVDRRRSEPTVGPRLIVTSEEVMQEVGGAPEGDHPLPGLLARLRDAGHHLGLIPLPDGDAPTVRTDPIDRDVVIVLSAVPLHDIGGGSRSTQLTLELVKQGYFVVYVSMYEAQESVDLGLRFIHPHLEQHNVTRFDVDTVAERAASPGIALVEAPAPVLVDSALTLRDAGWEIVYDLIDDWSDPALGGDWHDAATEQKLVERADRIVASAPDLVRRVDDLGRTAVLVPNAVNADIFGADLPPRPEDLPEAETIIGYHGSLYGGWFDWEALRSVAEAFPEAAVVIIGDDKAPHPRMPANVHFLGLKAQADLPAYLQRFDVGLIPFEISDTTHAVSPLKIYEYLASGVPVAAPPLRALDGLKGVNSSDDLPAGVRIALSSPRPDRRNALMEHTWEARVQELLPGRHPANRPGTSVTVRSRPSTHHDRARRLLHSRGPEPS